MKSNRALSSTLIALSLVAVLASRPAAAETPPSGSEPIEPLPPAPPPAAPDVPTDVAEIPATAKKTSSGLASRVLVKGKGGGHPGPHDRVTVHYTGWTTSGRMFDSSVTRGTPAKFPLDEVIKGWTEGLQLMVKGEKRRFWIPSELAYGDRPTRPGAPAGMLVFDVQLLDFVNMPEPPTVPPDVEAAPKDAKKTASGLAYKILKHGKGKEHPKAENTVEVHYSGWTPDGKMFDSSVTRGQPTSFPLDGVIKGWTEGVQLMVVGDKARFWIPGNLAYGEKPARPGAPAGTLVFDIELLSIK
ncbi:MAG TPA: FKBP-type peptidyl-prolyl cis-trans isomerase [Polyangia bacterium]|jgi:peptidylprolyl isomerase